MFYHRELNEQAISRARLFRIPHTIIGFANNGSFQPIETYNFPEPERKEPA